MATSNRRFEEFPLKLRLSTCVSWSVGMILFCSVVSLHLAWVLASGDPVEATTLLPSPLFDTQFIYRGFGMREELKIGAGLDDWSSRSRVISIDCRGVISIGSGLFAREVYTGKVGAGVWESISKSVSTSWLISNGAGRKGMKTRGRTAARCNNLPRAHPKRTIHI